MVNERIKKTLRIHNVPVWRLAELAGTSETTMFRRLRHELEPQEADRLIRLIEENARHGTEQSNV